MSVDLEIVGAASLGATQSKQAADLSGEPCRNCGAQVDGRYCPNCGQLAASFHRPIWELAGETIADVFTLDGRIARTLPVLMLRPGRLTKNYIDGWRARYVPPFRMFLLASLVFFTALFSIIGDGSWMDHVQVENSDGEMIALEDSEFMALVTDENGEIDQDKVRALVEEQTAAGLSQQEADFVLTAGRVIEDRRLFFAELEQWGPRLSFLLVPITILSLAFLHFWRRKIYIYHHAVHALHLHTWMFLAGSLLIFAIPLIGGTAGTIFGIAFFIYVWRSLKVVGETGYFMSFLRLFVMLIIWTSAVSSVVLASIIVSGLNAATPA